MTSKPDVQLLLPPGVDFDPDQANEILERVVKALTAPRAGTPEADQVHVTDLAVLLAAGLYGMKKLGVSPELMFEYVGVMMGAEVFPIQCPTRESAEDVRSLASLHLGSKPKKPEVFH